LYVQDSLFELSPFPWTSHPILSSTFFLLADQTPDTKKHDKLLEVRMKLIPNDAVQIKKIFMV